VSQRPLVINRSSVRAASTGGNPPSTVLSWSREQTMKLPDRIRTDAFAIRALSNEVSGVRESVSD